MRTKRFNVARWCLCGVILAGGLFGCQGHKTAYPFPFSDEWRYLYPQPAPGVVGLARPLIPDVGQPIGFKALVKQSHATVDGSARKVKHVYQGRARLQDVIDFYRRNLTRFNWKTVSQEHQANGFVVNNTKGVERLRLLFYTDGDRVTVVIMIGPIHYPPAPAANSPKPILELGGVG